MPKHSMPLKRVNPDLAMVIPEANRSFVAERLQCDSAWPIGLSDGIQHEVRGFRFVGIPAAHEALEVDEFGQHRFMGYIIKFGDLDTLSQWRIRCFIKAWLIG